MCRIPPALSLHSLCMYARRNEGLYVVKGFTDVDCPPCFIVLKSLTAGSDGMSQTLSNTCSTIELTIYIIFQGITQSQ